MWEIFQSMGGGLLAVGLLVIVFLGAAIYATRDSGAPPDGPGYPWIRLDDVVKIVRDPNWSWGRNNRCKYITLRVDTRTRSNLCVIYDRYGDPLTLDELRHQDGRVASE